MEFQSTLPVWGATGMVQLSPLSLNYFNPRSPCGERRHGRRDHRRVQPISIHAPRVGSDSRYLVPCRDPDISIHAPRVGSDPRRNWALPSPEYFNPRSPCGERLPSLTPSGAQHIFQSTLPVWGATVCSGVQHHGDLDFNPRSPCGERRGRPPISFPLAGFQSTLPVWGATHSGCYIPHRPQFQSTLPVWGAT